MKPIVPTILAVAAIGAAAVAFLADEPADAPRSNAGEPVLPGLQAIDADAVAAIAVTRSGETARVSKDADGVWRVEALDGYPADTAAVRRALTGLAGLTRVETRTARPENHARLDLADPDAEDGAARAASVFGPDGAPIADILLGRAGPSLGTTAATLFVRAPGDDQTWLAQGAADLSVDPLNWAESRFLNIRQERVRRVDVLAPSEGEPYAVLRAVWDQDDPTIEPLPEGRSLTTPGSARPMAFALESLRFDAVRRRPGDASGEIVARIETFGGLRIDVEKITLDGADWLAFSPSFETPAEAVPDAAFESDRNDAAKPMRPAEAEAEAAALAEALAPWLFQPPATRRDRFQRPVAEMTQAEEG
ncbi:MAG: DUF4340 domain-containing protein [Pseudomonadota bacterium]